MKDKTPKGVPADLRDRLEKTRQELLALFRGLDQLDVSPKEMPQKELRVLMELDADCAEALWALDNPWGLNLKMMTKETEKSLKRIPKVRQDFLAKLPSRVLEMLARYEAQIADALTVEDAYRGIPGNAE